MKEYKIIAEERMREYLEALRNGKSYDYICNHGHEFTKDELITIIKELDYAIYSEAKYAIKASDIYEAAATNMEDFMEFDKEE
jgi:hypothetical protein